MVEMSEKWAGDAIRHSEAMFRCIVESAQEYGIFTTDLQGRVTTWNIGAERCFGHAEAEILGQNIGVVFTDEDRAEGVPEQEMRSALATGRAKDIRWHLRKDGSRFWADGYLMLLQDDGGQAIGFVKIVRDRTEEKVAEARCQESQEQFRLMVESATDYVIFTTDRENRITTWNTGAERVLGYSEPEALGQDARIIFTPEDRAAGRPEQEIDTALSVGRAESERWHERKDGSRFWGSGQMMLLRNHQGDTRGFVKIFRDQTDQKLAEAEAQRQIALEEARKAAEASRTRAGGAGSDDAGSASDVVLAPMSNGRLATPTPGRQAAYGWRIHPVYGVRKFHSGMDIITGCGTPVVAAADGVVDSASWDGSYGNIIVLRHGDSGGGDSGGGESGGGAMSTAYAHLDEFAVKSGQVSRGEVIGYVGTTGLSTGCHLHFEVRVDGQDVDPARFI